MALKKEQKQKIIEKIKNVLEKQKIAVFVSIAGLKTKDVSDLRKKLKEKNCVFGVVKKTLLNIAFDKNFEADIKNLKGEIALISGIDDEISAPKIANKFSLNNKNLEILGGVFNNEFIGREKVIILANIPSKQELLAQLVGTIKAPISNFTNVVFSNIKGLVYTLNSIKNNKEAVNQ
ncbi:MAG: 50S ribosomal protein L10 [Candidatus Pacebacteria bacterium]|nr:50S ribosomal protein L10 [Candidatus Paceibacterota bacterium]